LLSPEILRKTERAGGDMQYQSPSIDAFFERVVHLANRGYYRFFIGELKEHSNPLGTDTKLVGKYGIEKLRKMPKGSKARRKARGLANVYYFRHERFFIVMATAGEIERFGKDESEDPWTTLQESSVVYGAYEAFIGRDGFKKNGQKKEKVRVRLRDEVFKNERADLLDMALRRQRGELESIIYNLPYNCFQLVRMQLRSILDEMNARRKKAGYELLSPGRVKFLRERHKHFILDESHPGSAP